MTKTPNINLNVPDYQDERWDIPVNENWELIDAAIAGKQATLTFDTTPTSGSSNPVTSDGLYLALLGKANDSVVAHKAGAETFTGIKTFDSGSATSLVIKSFIIDDTVTPSSNQYSNYIDMNDKNGVRIGRIFTVKDAYGNNGIAIQAWKNDTNKVIAVYSNGVTQAPTPPTSDNSTRIATTAYFRNNMQVVTALPASPTAGVFYFVKE